MSDNQPNLATPVTEQPSTLASPPTETGQAATSESPKVAAATTPRPKVPNPEQQAAIDQILQFIADPDPGHNFFILSGGAGTGKTFCMSSVQSALRGSRTSLAFTAPTNKAAKVLKGVVGHAKTIYSLLGLRIDTSGELKQIVAGEYTDLSDVDVIVLDEASLVNKHLIPQLTEHVNDGRLKIIFMGDNAQPPPVGEVSSPIWTEKNVPLAQLLKVERHDNQILKLVTHLRAQFFLPPP